MGLRQIICAALLGLATLYSACQDSSSSPGVNGGETGPDNNGADKGPEDQDIPDKLIDCDKLVATGNDPGEIPVDLIRMASTGKEISLRAHCNQPLLVLSGTAYCSG